MDDTFIGILLAVVALFLFLVVPVLAVGAWVRVRRLEKRPGAGAGDDLRAELQGVKQRLAELEKKVEALWFAPRAEARPAAAPAAPEAVKPAAPSPPPAPFVVAAPTHARLDLETIVAGRWLNRIGILALLFAAAFFLKYAFENHWVGPAGKVAIELLAGAGLLVYSQWLLGRGYRYFSEGIAALGAGVLYLALYWGWSDYAVFSQSVAFAAMMAVTAAMIGLAIGRDSQRIALLALIGGFLTPWLVSTGEDHQVVLFTYLAVLDAGLVALARARRWHSLELLAFGWTQIYFWEWHSRFYNDTRLASTLAFATLFFVLFAALPVVRSWKEGRLFRTQISLVLFNAFLFLLALRVLLWPERRWTLTLAVLALAAVHLVVARAVPRPAPGEAPLLRLLYAGLALTFVTLAIPIRLEGKWITIAWAVEGVVLLWSGLRAPLRFLRAAGWILFSIVALRLFSFPLAGGRLFLNVRFATFAVAVACFTFALVFARRLWDVVGTDERYLFRLLGILINVFALWALSLEVWDYLGAGGGAAPSLAQELGLSLLWTLYATALILAGVRAANPGLRWQALALFGLVVCKVFLYDLSSLERVYRIVSFLALGVVLLIVSFLYQRRLAGNREEPPG